MAIESVGGVSAGQKYVGNMNNAKQTSVNASAEISKESQNKSTKEGTALSEIKDNNSETATEKRHAEIKLENVNEFNRIINRNTIAEFGYNEPTNRITIKIKDKETNEIIKEIPSEKALEMLAKAWELAGLMVDEKR